MLFLSASGGTVDWSVSVSGDPGNTISVSPAESGTLTRAQPNVRLVITASKDLSCGRHGGTPCPTITIEPGGTAFTITTGRGHPFKRGRRQRHDDGPASVHVAPAPDPLPGLRRSAKRSL
jgi:hypothetical protein